VREHISRWRKANFRYFWVWEVGVGSSRVLLISRLTTQNAGNEALSKEMISFFLGNCLDADVRALDRYPRYFEKFTLDRLGADPVRAFDNIVEQLIARFKGRQAGRAPQASETLVRLDVRGTELKGVLRRAKRRLAVRKRLAVLGLIERAPAVTAVQACADSDLVIWNPAGEIHPVAYGVDHVLRLLILLGVAQRFGRKTAVINHSLEIEDKRLATLIGHVYRKLDYVGVRDASSIEVARQMGVREERLYESPDLVFLAIRRSGETVPDVVDEGTIALSINGLEAERGVDEWQHLMDGLKGLGRPLLLVSNAVNHDRDFALKLSLMVGGAKVVMHQPGYQALRGYYRPCSVLISSRLHSSILSLSEGVPVVSVEPSIFKLTAIFEQMDYPIGTERIQEVGWADRVLASVRQCLSEEVATMRERSIQAVMEQGRRIEAGYAPLLELVGS
jgi:polysaccharide pyruvyl transferase WcaK-like protein